MVIFNAVTTNSRGESFGRNVKAKVVMNDGLRLRIDAKPRLESNTAETVVVLLVMVILARALDVRDVKKYKAEPKICEGMYVNIRNCRNWHIRCFLGMKYQRQVSNKIERGNC